MNYKYILIPKIIFATFFFQVSVYGQDNRSSKASDQKYRFVSKTSAQYPELLKDSALKKNYNEFQISLDNKSFAKYEKRITEVSLVKDIKVIITITTSKDSAIVKYKPLDKTEAFEAAQPTNNCKIKLPLGYCTFWTERNGHKTSKEKKILVEDDATVFIEEIKE